MKKIFELIWKIYSLACAMGVLLLLLFLAIFGGNVHIDIDFESIDRLLEAFKQ